MEREECVEAWAASPASGASTARETSLSPSPVQPSTVQLSAARSFMRAEPACRTGKPLLS